MTYFLLDMVRQLQENNTLRFPITASRSVDIQYGDDHELISRQSKKAKNIIPRKNCVVSSKVSVNEYINQIISI